MIDIHNHIVWGIDDGSDSELTSFEMAMIAASSGITDIIATPHCIPGRFENFCGPEFDAALSLLRDALSKEKSTSRLRIHRGMEVFACDSTLDDYDSGKLCCLAESNYMLVECDFDEDPWFFRDVLMQLKQRGVRPIIAHPERYYFAHDSIGYLFDLVNLGCALQLDSDSIIGEFGNTCRGVALELLSSSAAQLIASDAHDQTTRVPDMRAVADYVAQRFSYNYASLLFEDNPRRILENRTLLFRGQSPSGGRARPSSRILTDEEYWGV